VISLHGGGSPAAMKQEIWRHYPVGDKVELVERLLERGVLADAQRGISATASPAAAATRAAAPRAGPDGGPGGDGAAALKVARLLDSLLTEAAPGAELDALLGASPALAELYENQHYAQAGLCRSPLEAGLKAELVAAATLRRAARMAA
jgi:hypothetical protein